MMRGRSWRGVEGDRKFWGRVERETNESSVGADDKRASCDEEA